MESLTQEQRALFISGGQLSDYEVLKPIGKGKFSIVYKAKCRRDNQAVALKKIAIFDMMDTKAREKTLKEVRLVQSVSHPNIIQYLDAFIANNELYIAFEWAEAGDLKRQIRKANEKNVRFDERTIWRYFTQLCSAILYMHRARIMHRDLKPANIFLTLQGVVKVGDLGLGRYLSENTMEAHSKVGTPLYMSPEVLRGEGYDWKSDVWSLGCILYELAMLRSPFKSEGLDLYGLFQKINKGDYEPVTTMYSDHLRRLVTQMISLSPGDRPSMEEVWNRCQQRPTSAALQERKENLRTESTTRQIDKDAETRSASASDVMRKRRKEDDAPTPENEHPQSRPPSQHKQQQESSSHSRPPSSQGDTSRYTSGNDEQMKEKRTEMRMELLFERIKILGYEKALKKRISSKHFMSPSRYLPQMPAHDHFEDMCILARWMLKLLGADTETELTMDRSPLVVVQQILIAAERAGVTDVGALGSPSLTCGVGEEVCILLDKLSIKALEANQQLCRTIAYPKEATEELVPDESVEVTAEDDQKDDGWGESTVSSPFLDQDEIFAQWIVVKDYPIPSNGVNGDNDGRNDKINDMIHSCIDPAAWKRELQQMLPKLKVRMHEKMQHRSLIPVWAFRMKMIQDLAALLNSNRSTLCHEITNTQQARQEEVNRIQILEKRLNESRMNARRMYHEQATRLVSFQENSQELQTRVNLFAVELSKLQHKCVAVSKDLNTENAKLTDNSIVIKLKHQVKRLEQENDQFSIQIHMLSHYLLQKQLQHQASSKIRR